MDERERDLVDLVAVAGGGVEALSRLYDRHAPRMAAVVRAIAGGESMGDVFRESWAEARARATSYDPRMDGPVATWLLAIARERALGATAARGLKLESEAWTRGEVSHLAGEPLDAAARDALEALPSLTRQALLGAWLEGLPLSKLAQRLEVDETRVIVWLREGLLELSTATTRGELV